MVWEAGKTGGLGEGEWGMGRRGEGESFDFSFGIVNCGKRPATSPSAVSPSVVSSGSNDSGANGSPCRARGLSLSKAVESKAECGMRNEQEIFDMYYIMVYIGIT